MADIIMDIPDDFWSDYDRDNKNLKLFIELITDVSEYTGKDIDFSKWEVKRPKKLNVSIYIKPNGNNRLF